MGDVGLIDPATLAPDVSAPNGWTVLCVDDEPNILSALRRLLRGRGYRVLVAQGGAEAVGLFERETIDLVISDMRMPGMDGAQLLERVRAGWPHVVRILLTGYADIKSTVAAINRGEVYRYITKPWNDDELLSTLEQAFEQQSLLREKHRLQALTHQQNEMLSELNASLEEKVGQRTHELSLANEKLAKNYMASIRLFSNLIELRGGQLVGHSRRVADLTRRTALAMNCGGDELQQMSVAALLHDIGQIGLPDTLLATPVPRLSDGELGLYRNHPALGEQALMAMDDLQLAATLIRAHHERHDGNGFPDRLAGNEIALGARIIAIADTYDDLQNGALGVKLDPEQARTLIARGRGTQFHPEVVDVFLQVLLAATPHGGEAPVMVRSDALLPGMVLARELVSSEGMVLLPADHLLTADLIERIRRHEGRGEVLFQLWIKPQRKVP